VGICQCPLAAVSPPCYNTPDFYGSALLLKEKKMKKPYQKTMYACFIGYIVQAIVNNFVPLLFVTFQTDYRVPLQKITLLITVNFLIQLCVDLLSAGFIDRIG
jgi:hypothetical protein